MLDTDTLYPGARVRIVSEPPTVGRWNPIMGAYLGQILTVLEVHEGYVKMVEDNRTPDGSRRWFWFPEFLESLEEETYESEQDLSILYG